MKSENSWKTKILLFFISQSVTLFGSTLVQMAVIWYVTLQTSRGIWVAAFSVCSYLPQFLLSFVGGVWADRYDRKKLIIAADAGIALITLAVFGILSFDDLERGSLGILLLMSGLRSVGAGIQTPAVSAVIPGVVPGPYLMRYNGIYGALQSVVQFAAPAAAGVLLSFLSLRMALLVDVVTAILGIILLAGIPIPRQESLVERERFFTELQAGIAYSRSNNRIGRVLAIYGMFVLLCVPGGFLAGLFVNRIYGETYWYLTVTELAGFAGMTAGGILMGIWGGFQGQTGEKKVCGREKTLAVGLICFGLLSAGMGMAWAFPVYLLLMGFYGVALTTVQTAATVLLQENTEAWMQGRVLGLMQAVYAGSLPLGMAVFGAAADFLPMQGIMALGGAALVGMGLWVEKQGIKGYNEKKK